MGQRGDAPARSVPKSVPKSVPASGDTVSGATWPKKAATKVSGDTWSKKVATMARSDLRRPQPIVASRPTGVLLVLSETERRARRFFKIDRKFWILGTTPYLQSLVTRTH